MRHEDGKQGRTASPSLHLLLLLLSLHGSSARTVIIGRGRIIADLGEPPAPTLPRIGHTSDALLFFYVLFSPISSQTPCPHNTSLHMSIQAGARMGCS